MENKGIWRDGLVRAFHPKYLFSDLFDVSGGKRLYLLFLLAIQLVSFFVIFSNGQFHLQVNPTIINMVSLLAAVTGVFSVVLVANGRITNYFWGVVESLAYIYVSFDSHLYGEVYLNLFFITMDFIGIYQWSKADHQKDQKRTEKVISRAMSVRGWVLLTISILIAWWLLSQFLLRVPFITPQLDPHPYVDSMSTVLQVFAMILMAFRFGASQWTLWNISHIAELILWTVNFNPVMLALWIAFSINSIYGFYVWTFKLTDRSNHKKEAAL
ncbi:nicotinamide mononucleotide transporter [Secundilactobacillus pentosiphilus]|uniref:Nicotinamide mononucleotide transporter n=1 Tax=Secundilactobacillus pentosiphilus TaxID=1714682 RepID=A0A1Z5IQ99_9LACO|nr:nicotinamide riboside transporter PnuC [Secundilactobacillus pentosiphilus]GAX03933.1 nicotinamide mononucleotide transporter [Secundilactobacillus pentosiphilus]